MLGGGQAALRKLRARGAKTRPRGGLEESTSAAPPEKTGQSITVKDVKDHIKPLKRGREPGDEPPPAVEDSPLLEDGVVNRDDARKVKGKQRWIVPSANGEAVCIVATSEVACPPASALAERGADVSVSWHADTPVRVPE